jgi:hypothetical protein
MKIFSAFFSMKENKFRINIIFWNRLHMLFCCLPTMIEFAIWLNSVALKALFFMVFNALEQTKTAPKWGCSEIGNQ